MFFPSDTLIIRNIIKHLIWSYDYLRIHYVYRVDNEHGKWNVYYGIKETRWAFPYSCPEIGRLFYNSVNKWAWWR
jgi:hypothetical protein